MIDWEWGKQRCGISPVNVDSRKRLSCTSIMLGWPWLSSADLTSLLSSSSNLSQRLLSSVRSRARAALTSQAGVLTKTHNSQLPKTLILSCLYALAGLREQAFSGRNFAFKPDSDLTWRVV